MFEGTAFLMKRISIERGDVQHGSDKLYFFYDESNNIRTFRNKDGKFNNPAQLNFVLGGIVSSEDIELHSLDNIKDLLTLDKSFTEIKFGKVLAANAKQGEFLKKIGSKNLEFFLTYLLERDSLFIHISVLNPFFYAIVDIIDIITYHNESRYFPGLTLEEYHRILKGGLYKILLTRYDECGRLFHKYGIPYLKDEHVGNFLSDFVSLISSIPVSGKENSKIKDEIICSIVRKKKIIRKEGGGLTFFSESEQRNQLVSDFSTLYQQKIFVYDNSFHLFDKEDFIEELWRKNGFLDSSFRNRFDFTESKADIRIQISDGISGLIANFFDYLSFNSIEKIKKDFSLINKDSLTYKNLELLRILLNKSCAFERLFVQYVVPKEDLDKFRAFLNGEIKLSHK